MAFCATARYAARRWRHRPGLAVGAILTLGFGIACATTTFSVVDAVLLKPLPWAKPETLVVVHGVYPDRRVNPATAPTWNRWQLSFPAWDALRASAVFEAVGAWYPGPSLDTTFGEHRDQIVTTINVSSEFLPMLGVRLLRGRFFTEAEDATFSDSVLLTEETWRRRFGGRDDIIGQRVMLGSARVSEAKIPKTVVGIIAEGFEFDGIRPEVFRPLGESRRPPDSTLPLRVVARLSAGVALSSANSQAQALVSASTDSQPAGARLVSIADEQLGSARRPLWLLFGSAGFLLLIACSNVAGLLLAEARVRRHEFAVRAALGGTRLQMFRQLMVEHGLLAIGGTVAGLVGATWLTNGVVAIAPAGMPRIDLTTVDARAVLFATGSGLVTLLVSGAWPALADSRLPISRGLGHGARDGGPSPVAAQRLAVVVQVALAFVLVTSALLFAQTLLRLRAQPLGVVPDGVAVASTTFTGSLYGEPDVVEAAWKSADPNASPGVVLGPLQRAATVGRTEAVLARLAAIPGVVGVAAASAVPLVAEPLRVQVVLEERPAGETHDVLRQVVTDGYFSTMGIRVLTGRDSGAEGSAGSVPAVVSSAFERHLFPDGAIGRRFSYGVSDPSSTYQIVGVVADVKRREPSEDDRPLFYTDYRLGGTPNHFVLRSAGASGPSLTDIRRAIGGVSPQMVVTSMTTLSSQVEDVVAEERFRATLSTAFGSAALFLSTVGLYALVGRLVADRHREFGVRMALGARPADIRRLIVRDALAVVSLGVGVGLPVSYVVSLSARGLFFGVAATSPYVFALAAALLLIAVVAATVVPVRQSGRIDPAQALRN